MAALRITRFRCVLTIPPNPFVLGDLPQSHQRQFSFHWNREGEKQTIQSVAVLGAGVAGLSATKSCLEEGLQPVCFEQANQIGGTWFFTEEEREGQTASVYKHLIMNVSKEMTRFSDFPMPNNFPTFPNCHQFYSYLNSYANHFNLRHRIRVNTKVQRVTPLVPGRIDCGWRVAFNDVTGREKVEEFDALLVCSGFNKVPAYPQVEGLDAEGLEVKHMQNIRTFDYLNGKNVLVIGNQNSAGDAANLASHAASSVFLSIGDEGTNIVPRWARNGLPCDVISPRWEATLKPSWLSKRVLKNQANSMIDHKAYGLTPRKDTTKVHVMINDDLPEKIRRGQVKVKPKVVKVEEGQAFFSDGSTVGPIDSVICATGYMPDFEYIDCDILQENRRQDFHLYHGVFPLETSLPTLGCIGGCLVNQASPPALEMQARWAAQVLAGKCRLPHPDVRKEVWKAKKRVYDKQGNNKENIWTTMDTISEEFGARPTFGRILGRSPRLALRFLLGPPLPTYYRLFGPGSNTEAWEGAHKSYDTSRLIANVSR